MLPSGFQRLRSYGLFANRHRTENLERCRRLLGVDRLADPPEPDASPEPGGDGESLEEEILRLTGLDPMRCPVCGQGRLLQLEPLPAWQDAPALLARAPP